MERLDEQVQVLTFAACLAEVQTSMVRLVDTVKVEALGVAGAANEGSEILFEEDMNELDLFCFSSYREADLWEAPSRDHDLERVFPSSSGHARIYHLRGPSWIAIRSSADSDG